MLAVLGIPAIDRCNGDARGLLQCLRSQVGDKFDLGLDPPPAAVPLAVAVAEPVAAAAPAFDAAETLPAKPPLEATRSLVPQFKPAPPGLTQTQVVSTPPVAPDLDLLDAATEPQPVAVLPEGPDADPAEASGLAAPTELAPPTLGAPLPRVAVDQIPVDTAITAEPAAAVPEIALPEAPALPGLPLPDVVVEPVEPEAVVPSSVPLAVEGRAPDPQVVMGEPEPASVAEPAPDVTLPNSPPQPDLTQPDLAVAAIDPATPAETSQPVIPGLALSIDAVEIDGDGNSIAGTGPAGATMRLYVDGIPVGVSPVEAGRWLVEGTDLLTEEQQTLRVEAIDPLTGKVVGDATIVFEGPVAPAPAADHAVPPSDSAPDFAPSLAPVVESLEPEAVTEPPAIPPLASVVPTGESASVTILETSDSAKIPTLTTGNPSDDALVTLRTVRESAEGAADITGPLGCED